MWVGTMHESVSLVGMSHFRESAAIIEHALCTCCVISVAALLDGATVAMVEFDDSAVAARVDSIFLSFSVILSKAFLVTGGSVSFSAFSLASLSLSTFWSMTRAPC
jgi:hypothetical protein